MLKLVALLSHIYENVLAWLWSVNFLNIHILLLAERANAVFTCLELLLVVTNNLEYDFRLLLSSLAQLPGRHLDENLLHLADVHNLVENELVEDVSVELQTLVE